MKHALTILLCILASSQQGSAQRYLESLHDDLARASDDTSRALALCGLAEYHEYRYPDSNQYYVDRCVALCDKINYPIAKFFAYQSIFYTENLKSNYSKALEVAQDNLNFASTLKNAKFHCMEVAYIALRLVSGEMGEMEMAKKYFKEALLLDQKAELHTGDTWGMFGTLAAGFPKSQPDSILKYATLARTMAHQSPHNFRFGCLATAQLADRYSSLGDFESARKYYQIALSETFDYDNIYIEARVYRDLAVLFNKFGKYDSCIYFGQLGLERCRQYRYGDYASGTALAMTNAFESMKKPDSALKYMRNMMAARDTIFGQANIQHFRSIIFREETKQREIAIAKERFENQVKLYASIIGVILLSVISYILYRNNQHRKRSYLQLQRQKQLTDEEKVKVQQTLEELRNTQAQLVHSEKMASLGELTAGIAHEIQNPLNFVNNFSEVNLELTEELEKDLVGIPIEASSKTNLLTTLHTIADNQGKIIHHGKRADTIVKGMLEHSRGGTGLKESRDLNALVQEYARLSYHGFKAKNKSFEAGLNMELDPTIGNIPLVAQDTGRILVNLLTNAFYSVYQKSKSAPSGYQPEVKVSTKKAGNRTEVTIRDNGLGIPEKNISKIFQPFYTTKPTGEGTGLGLSLSYDMMKANGGDLRVESVEGEYAAFTMII